MDSLSLLIPLSVMLVLLIGAVLTWAALSGQFENLEAEGKRILDERGQSEPEKAEHRPTNLSEGASEPRNTIHQENPG
jgi:cbb3-type cytochrome oxidase maturation protein